MLRIATVETADTYMQKPRTPPAQLMAPQKLPYSEADFANATPEEARQMARANRERQLANQKVQAAIAIDAYEKAQAHLEGTRLKLQGTVFGRQVILAADKFAGMAGEYFDSNCIEFIPDVLVEDHKGGKDQFLKNMSSTGTLGTPYFINLVFDNPRIETSKVNMAGQVFKRTKITIAVTYQVQAPNGRMETSGIVKKEKILKSSGAVQCSGVEEGALIDMMEEALAEVAKRINDHFVAKVTVRAVSAEDMRPLVSIDKDDIENKTDSKAADFSILIDYLTQGLVSTGRYRVMNKADLVRKLKEGDCGSLCDDDGGKTKVVTPNFFIGMTVTTYGITSAATQNALTGSVTATEVGKIELGLKVMDARTGETVKAVKVSSSAMGQVTTSDSNLRQQVLQAAAKKACEKIVYELIKLTPFGILDVKNGEVTLDVPGTLTIMGKPLQPGTQFAVSKIRNGKKNRHTGKVMRSETLVAVVGVTSVGEKSCSARILSGAIPPIGDDEDTQYDPYIVKIYEGASAPKASTNRHR